MSKDLPNRTLLGIVGLLLAVGTVAAVVFGVSDAQWAKPGSPLLQSLAIAGAVLLCGSYAAAMAKRFAIAGKRAFRQHVALASLGGAMVLAHWSFSFWQFPTLLIAALVLLVWLGLWSRTSGARQMARTFGEKHAGFHPPAPENRARMRAIIAEKEALLSQFAPSAREAEFSLRPVHWVGQPRRAWSYNKLCREERTITGADRRLPRAQRYWRIVHQLLAAGFICGLILHILMVLFFAGYVADGRDIYWWHVTDWNF